MDTPQSFKALVGLCETVNARLERNFWPLAVLFLLAIFISAIISDLTQKMWVDELYTLRMAQQRNVGEIVQATKEGCDGSAPLYAILVHGLLPSIRPIELAVRLPATIGYCGMILCMFVFCRRRMPAIYSFIAVLLVCSATLEYASEGRAYGLVLFGASLALASWQAADIASNRVWAIPTLYLSLALIAALHYYALFFPIPLLIAEFGRWRKTGKLDIAICCSMASALLLIALQYPLISAGQRFQEHYWSPATPHSIATTYGRYVKVLAPIALIPLFSRNKGENVLPEDAGLTPPEKWAAYTYLLLPLFVILISIVTTHVFVERYTLWAVPGIALVTAQLLLNASCKGNSAAAITACGLLLFVAQKQLKSDTRKPALREGEAIYQQLKLLNTDDGTPILVADHHVFMELSYYAPQGIRRRLLYPIQPDLDLKYFGSNTGPLILFALKSRTDLAVVPYAKVLAANKTFLIAALPKDYLPRHLMKLGYTLEPAGPLRPPLIYFAKAPSLHE